MREATISFQCSVFTGVQQTIAYNVSGIKSRISQKISTNKTKIYHMGDRTFRGHNVKRQTRKECLKMWMAAP
jgi:hypothetical protein